MKHYMVGFFTKKKLMNIIEKLVVLGITVQNLMLSFADTCSSFFVDLPDTLAAKNH